MGSGARGACRPLVVAFPGLEAERAAGPPDFRSCFTRSSGLGLPPSRDLYLTTLHQGGWSWDPVHVQEGLEQRGTLG